jgi:hypothetical protein
MTNNVVNVWKQSVYQVPACTNPIYLNTTDNLATVLSAGYLAPQIAAGLVINANDLIFISYNGGAGMFIPSNASSAGSVILSSVGTQVAQVNLTAAQFNGMYAAPVLLVAAPGAGYMNILESMLLDMTYGSAAFASGGPVAAQYDSTAHGAGVLASNAEQAADFFQTANTVFPFIQASGNGSFLLTASCANKGIYLSNTTGAFTTGTGSSFKASVFFRTVAV